MFTGLIEGIGKVVESRRKTLRIQTPFRNLKRGESVAIDGVCLTVTSLARGEATFDIGPETKRVTTLGSFQQGRRVNLERALRYGDRLGGHWVTGHVEGTGRVRSVMLSGRSWWYDIEIPASLRRFIVEKGSLAVDGISLTVAQKKATSVRLMIIPHTRSHTVLADRGPSDLVNLETDLLAKYALGARMPAALKRLARGTLHS